MVRYDKSTVIALWIYVGFSALAQIGVFGWAAAHFDDAWSTQIAWLLFRVIPLGWAVAAITTKQRYPALFLLVVVLFAAVPDILAVERGLRINRRCSGTPEADVVARYDCDSGVGPRRALPWFVLLFVLVLVDGILSLVVLILVWRGRIDKRAQARREALGLDARASSNAAVAATTTGRYTSVEPRYVGLPEQSN